MSLRRKLIRLAHENPELRPDLLPLLKQAARGPYQMGAWQGQDHFWPVTPRDWQEVDYEFDAFKSPWMITYQWVGKPSMNIFVKVDAESYIRSEGRRPGTWVAEGVGHKTHGTWDSPDEIPRVLASAVKWGEQYVRHLEKQVESLGGSNWEVWFNGYSAEAAYKGPRTDYSDAGISVTFDDADTVLANNGDRATATIFFSKGADYQGHYGKREVEETYSSIRDMARILSKAEALFTKWDAE